MSESTETLPAENEEKTAVGTSPEHPNEGSAVHGIPRPETASHRIQWPYAIAFLLFHLLALLAFAPWLFSWTGVALVFIGNFVFGSLGVNLGYHRLLTHRGMVVPKWLEHGLALLGVCCLQDAPARWVAIHRMHHQHSDKQPDPHSPLVDFLWGHVGWLVYKDTFIGTAKMYDRYARDLMRDPFYFRLERNLNWFWVYLIHAIAFFVVGTGAGYLMHGQWPLAVQFGASVFVWGVIVRTVYVWHITWAVNSVTHLWGYRNYETKDNSKNNWVIGLTNNGEGWHNNHHAHPRCAAHGHQWWELDLTYWSILLLEKLGLAKEVVHPTPKILQSKSEG
ncbi:acyl-CoA desaturase [Stieleria varia]|uniref:Fatty acid desaturase n=1 Tax=Stieleria varia TaxID=2528005 RepID=A0A5C6B8I3_9BACT|nr:fatty acid desaturase [Stieleria varia]TWU08077.1 Fatty acid desaturase [Stieleria varia]